jgi:glyoxylase-like metal-dependent hydrolase (beta-lactamase superfamily II)
VKNGEGPTEGAERGAPAGGSLAAYIVYHRRGGLVYVGDFLFTDLDDFTLLMNEFIRRMHRERAEAVTTVFFGHPGLRRRLQRLGFWRIQTERSVVLNTLGVETSPETAVLHEPDSWFFTQADIDSDR